MVSNEDEYWCLKWTLLLVVTSPDEITVFQFEHSRNHRSSDCRMCRLLHRFSVLNCLFRNKKRINKIRMDEKEYNSGAKEMISLPITNLHSQSRSLFDDFHISLRDMYD
ncbi:hypothetical protein AB6A40_004064 [Gnathostoma spinigerum]|uniref:Uncharacterized protein n=1 Tax=Gnathostoma spinigerum TaxID=75299 RepID=A0ABD6EM48_9BILA